MVYKQRKKEEIDLRWFKVFKKRNHTVQMRTGHTPRTNRMAVYRCLHVEPAPLFCPLNLGIHTFKDISMASDYTTHYVNTLGFLWPQSAREANGFAWPKCLVIYYFISPLV